MTFLPKNGLLPNCPNPLAIRTACFARDLLRWPDAFLKSWLAMDFELWEPGSFLHFWTDHQPLFNTEFAVGETYSLPQGIPPHSGRRSHALCKHGAHSLQVWRDWFPGYSWDTKGGSEPFPLWLGEALPRRPDTTCTCTFSEKLSRLPNWCCWYLWVVEFWVRFVSFCFQFWLPL